MKLKQQQRIILESFRFWDEDDYEDEVLNTPYYLVFARESTSFWRENVVTVVILLVAGTSNQILED